MIHLGSGAVDEKLVSGPEEKKNSSHSSASGV